MLFLKRWALFNHCWHFNLEIFRYILYIGFSETYATYKHRAKINVGLEDKRWCHACVRHRNIKKWVCDGYMDCRLTWCKEISLKLLMARGDRFCILKLLYAYFRDCSTFYAFSNISCLKITGNHAISLQQLKLGGGCTVHR